MMKKTIPGLLVVLLARRNQIFAFQCSRFRGPASLLRQQSWGAPEQVANYQYSSLVLFTSPSAVPNEDGGSQKKTNPAQRMRRRKVKIYNVKKMRNVGLLFALWYTLSMAYNIFSKRVLNLAPELAWTAAWAQMALGLLYVLPLWMSGLRTAPTLGKSEIGRLLPVALLHSLVHVGGVVSMGAGAVSFTYIVKATEPAVSAILAALILKSFLPIPVYLTLIPVIGGVSLASVSELSFTWKSFNYAMMSNVASASRGIVGKKTMGKRLGKNLNAMNLYAVLTILATLVLLPITTVLEGSQWTASIQRLKDAGQLSTYLVQSVLAAFTYYTYNEVSFLCLDNVDPLSHALASTLRRVFIITSSMLVFGNKMTGMGMFGSTLAVGGALLYSMAKYHYNNKGKKPV
jgi:solute carrier family 35 protein E1